MYNQKMVATIKANGKILREFNDTVYVPFGTEYSVLLKNLNTIRCIANVFLDGIDVVPGGLVILAGQTVDLERWIKNGNLSEGNKFKFIERTAQIEKHKGIGAEDGLVRIEFQFERAVTHYPNIWNHNNTVYGNGPFGNGLQYPPGCRTLNVGGAMRRVDISKDGWASAQAGANVDQYCADNGIKNQSAFHNGPATMDSVQAQSLNDAGITVAGSVSTQKFQTTNNFALLDEKHCIVLRLLGETADNKAVIAPVTIKTKPTCTTCGRVNKAKTKFCSECGTSLTLF